MAKVCCGKTFWGDANKYLQFSKGNIIAVNGSTIEDTLTLSDLTFGYDTLSHVRYKISKTQQNFYINSDGATFLAVVARYDSKSVNEPDNYLTYYYADNPANLYNMGKLIILTGNSANTLTSIYLNNPSEDYDVNIDVLIGMYGDGNGYYTEPEDLGNTFYNLLYTQLGTGTINQSIVLWNTNSPRQRIAEFNIISVNILRTGNLIRVDEQMTPQLYLYFKDENEAKQAQSLINYVINNDNIVIDTLNPMGDSIAPIIYFYANVTNGVTTGNAIVLYDENGDPSTLPSPYNTSQGFDFRTSISLSVFGTSGAITKEDLLSYCIDTIEDNRDGLMVLDTENCILKDMATSKEVNVIGAVGDYTITFNISDIAGNKISNTVVLKVTITA